jgi:hypothetical protein
MFWKIRKTRAPYVLLVSSMKINTLQLELKAVQCHENSTRYSFPTRSTLVIDVSAAALL